MRHFPNPRRSNRGFSAVEIIAVATVIAILALILIPMLRERVAQSRITAAKDEMKNLATAIVLAYAENSRYFRLQDLDNSTRFSGTTDDRTATVPFAYYDQSGGVLSLNNTQRRDLSRTWNGPYTTAPHTISIAELIAARPQMVSTAGGPIAVFTNENADRYPVDPWGNPYLFFISVETLYGTQTSYQGNPVIFSMGPDGMPGNLPNANAQDYFPQTGPLGQGDDLIWNL